MTKKTRRVLGHPTQAKTGLEWGTQLLLPVKKAGHPHPHPQVVSPWDIYVTAKAIL
jgi:hypothetical protein